MSFEAHDPQALDHWYWLGTQIRCALDPDEPRLLDQYLGEARYLAGWEGVAAWPLFEKAYNLLLDTGRDPMCPGTGAASASTTPTGPSANFSD